MGVLSWLSQNAVVLSAAASMGMLIVWALYATLLYREYRERRRPRIAINQTPEGSTSAECLLINLSRETVLVTGILLVAKGQKVSFTRQFTEYSYASDGERSQEDIRTHLKQGPLHPGDMLMLGSFGELIEQATAASVEQAIHELDIERLEIRVLMNFGSEAKPLGAKRGYSISGDGATIIKPETLWTTHMVSRSQRKQVQQWLEECMEPTLAQHPLRKEHK